MTLLKHSGDPAPDVALAWSALREHLARKCRELNHEVSSYPTPIARCDVQLPKLLEQRAAAVRRLRLADEAREAVSIDVTAGRLGRLADFLLILDDAEDDDIEHALRRRVADALSGSIGQTDPPIRY